MFSQHQLDCLDIMVIMAIEGVYESGERVLIKSTEITSKYKEIYGVDKYQSIRQAVSDLAQKGYIEADGKKGVRLSKNPSEINLAEIFEAAQTLNNTDITLKFKLSQYLIDCEPNDKNPLIKNYYALKKGYDAMIKELSKVTLDDYVNNKK